VSEQESHPRQMLWATRNIWLVKYSKVGNPETEEKLKLLKRFRREEVEKGILKDQGDSSEADAAVEPEDEIMCDWAEIDRAIDETQNRLLLERSDKYHVLDYLTLPQPRTSQKEALKGRLCKGHGIIAKNSDTPDDSLDWDDVEFIDWWGPTMSFQGKMLRAGSADKLKHATESVALKHATESVAFSLGEGQC